MAEAERRSITPEEFLESYPLHTIIKSGTKNFEVPKAISRVCDTCGKETTWNLGERRDNNTLSLSKCFTLVPEYSCQKCRTETVVFFVRAEWPREANAVLQKIGQFPAPSVSISTTLEKQLGETAEYYKRGLISQNYGYGLGALAYMRRVVEEKTNQLIEVVADLAAAQNEPAPVVKALRSAATEKTTYDQKLRIASEAMPASLKPDGANALGALFELISKGLHGGSESECLTIADEIRDVFEHVFSTLRAQVDAQKNMSAKIKKWVGARAEIQANAPTKPPTEK